MTCDKIGGGEAKGGIIIISYKPLFKLLLEKDMTKTQLRESVGFSTSTLAKLSKNEYVSLEIIDNICQFFECKVEDVIEINHKTRVKIKDYTKIKS